VFNLQGSEIIFILLLALVVLGPEKLPGAIKRAMKTYAELRKLGSGFQEEFKSAIDQPMREMRETADLIKDQIDPKKFAEDAERAVDAAASADRADAALVAAGESADVDDLHDDMADDGDNQGAVVSSVDDDIDDPFDDPVDPPIDTAPDTPAERVAPAEDVDDAIADESMEESA
jgi:sec-independent protein translocase protein TatB